MNRSLEQTPLGRPPSIRAAAIKPSTITLAMANQFLKFNNWNCGFHALGGEITVMRVLHLPRAERDQSRFC